MGAAVSGVVTGQCQTMSLAAADVILSECMMLSESSKVSSLRSRRTGVFRRKSFDVQAPTVDGSGDGATVTTSQDASLQDTEDSVDRENTKTRKKTSGVDPIDVLRRSCSRGDLKYVIQAISSGAKVNEANSRGTTPLMLAAASSGSGSCEVLQELKSRKANINARDSNGWTPLLFACRNGKCHAAKFLLLHGADPKVVTSDYKNALILAAMEGSTELVSILVSSQHTCKQIADADAFMWTALTYAVNGGFEDIVRILVDKGAKLKTFDHDGMTPLAIASQHGRLECVKILCKKKANVNAKDKRQRTPLIHACLANDERTAIWLFTKGGAEPWGKDDEDNSALSLAEEFRMGDFREVIKKRWSEEKDEDF